MLPHCASVKKTWSRYIRGDNQLEYCDSTLDGERGKELSVFIINLDAGRCLNGVVAVKPEARHVVLDTIDIEWLNIRFTFTEWEIWDSPTEDSDQLLVNVAISTQWFWYSYSAISRTGNRACALGSCSATLRMHVGKVFAYWAGLFSPTVSRLIWLIPHVGRLMGRCELLRI